ncbi:acyl-CoA thioesterase [Arthrobacter sp. RHLT1-20]
MNPTGPLPRTATAASLERTIEWVDTDAAGHQHNSAVLRFVEACEARLFRELGLPEYFPSAPRVRHEFNYRAKLYFGQRVTTTVVVEKIGRTSMTFGLKCGARNSAGNPVPWPRTDRSSRPM